MTQYKWLDFATTFQTPMETSAPPSNFVSTSSNDKYLQVRGYKDGRDTGPTYTVNIEHGQCSLPSTPLLQEDTLHYNENYAPLNATLSDDTVTIEYCLH